MLASLKAMFLTDSQAYREVNWAIADQALVSVVNFLTAVLLARHFGVDEFGRFTLLWLFIGFIGSLQHALVTAPMMSIGSKESKHELPGYYGAVITHQLGLMGVILLTTIIGMQSIAEGFPEWRVEEVVFPVCGALAACGMQDFVRRYLFTCERSYAAFKSDAVRYIGQLVGLFLLIKFFTDEMSLPIALWTMCATGALATLSGAVIMDKPKFSYSVIRKTASRHWQSSRWLLGSTVFYALSHNLFILVAGSLLGVKAVGALKASQTLMGVTHILFFGLENVAPARSSLYYHEGGTPRLVSYLWRIAVLGGLATAMVAAVAVAAPEFWLGVIFGEDYAQYGYLIVWYALSYLVFFLAVPLRAGLRALERTRMLFYADLWMLFVGLVAAYPLVSFLGVLGAAMGSLVTYMVLVATLAWGFKKELRMTRLDFSPDLSKVQSRSVDNHSPVI
ncbi:MAG: polysaccharide biosynthesis C-terminal domain-containing protein [Nitrososphaera sp.]|nr:polysaccharide biosynthesis C-terminal domain-containing protein [Nitrososphaera sp.]